MAAEGKNVLIMAGGTGGHVFPALACAREFQKRGYSAVSYTHLTLPTNREV